MADLHGRYVVVTRPAHQAQTLSDLIERHGGHAIRFPVLEIVPKTDTDFLQRITHLNDYHIALFISPNAVTHAIEAINAHGGMPANLQIGAVGQATAAALAALNCPVHIFPQHKFDSESLLALPALQAVRDKNIVIFRGQGGRELLAETLRQRGAHVHYGECYQRRKPDNNAQLLLKHWAQHKLDIIIITSVEGLHNLMDMVGLQAQDTLLRTPLLVVSERMAQEARKLGFKSTLVCAAKASDEEIVTSLLRWVEQA